MPMQNEIKTMNTIKKHGNGLLHVPRSKPPRKHEMDYNNYVTWKNKKHNMIKKKKLQLTMNIEDLHFYNWSWKNASWIMNHGWWWVDTNGVSCNQWSQSII